MNVSSAVRSEGGLLPADLIARILSRDRDLPGLQAESYHLAPGEQVNEAAARSWTRLSALWVSFQSVRAKAKPEDAFTKETRERWLLPLFQELGYGRLDRWDATSVGTRSYAISHRWEALPIHLIGANLRLDRRTPGVAHAAAANPHGLLQEFLNRADEYLWGILSNGLKLRILRDNACMTRQAFLEFDLEDIFDSSSYPDFVTLWLMAHQSRFEGDKKENWLIERWSKSAAESGARALDRLRDGVENALEILGTGFLQHPANGPLRERLVKGTLSRDDYKRQLLRVAYRLLFLFVAEDRGLLLDPGATAGARERYRRFYSTDRLRHLAMAQAGTSHGDAWELLRILFNLLDSDRGCPDLALYPMGGRLFNAQACADIEGSALANSFLFAALRALCLTQEESVRRAVDFHHLGAEELGSVYEALLEQLPRIDLAAGMFDLVYTGGNERKTTGSYYTPTPLIQTLLRAGLDPLLAEASRSKDPEASILALRICDPACGSGHFLVAAAHRIAQSLATVRSGDAEPAPEEVRHAMRDVTARCIYGVDYNPLAVELCQVSLWLEALDPGKPLSFLDHHIKCGNSLVGATPALLAKGIPDEAFEPIEGDEKKHTQSLKRLNREEHTQRKLDFDHTTDVPSSFQSRIEQINAIDDSSVGGIREREHRYDALQGDASYCRARMVADAWCSAFYWKKVQAGLPAITQDTIRRLKDSQNSISEAVRSEVNRLGQQFRYFHWHLAFPDVMGESLSSGDGAPSDGRQRGFDLVLGNPPWDTLSPDAKEFFSTYEPEVRFKDKEGQDRIIARLLEDPGISHAWGEWCRTLYAHVHFFKNSGRYTMFAPGNLGKGDLYPFRGSGGDHPRGVWQE